MQETRAVYSFDSVDEALLPMSIAFNIHFYKQELPEGKWAAELTDLRKKAVVSLRINPVSTVFVVDIFSDDDLTLPDTYEFYTPSEEFSLEDVNQDHRIVLLPSPDGRLHTLVGDYLRVCTKNTLSAIKQAAGV
jgi:hypothetical protein